MSSLPLSFIWVFLPRRFVYAFRSETTQQLAMVYSLFKMACVCPCVYCCLLLFLLLLLAKGRLSVKCECVGARQGLGV